MRSMCLPYRRIPAPSREITALRPGDPPGVPRDQTGIPGRPRPRPPRCARGARAGSPSGNASISPSPPPRLPQVATRNQAQRLAENWDTHVAHTEALKRKVEEASRRAER